MAARANVTRKPLPPEVASIPVKRGVGRRWALLGNLLMFLFSDWKFKVSAHPTSKLYIAKTVHISTLVFFFLLFGSIQPGIWPWLPGQAGCRVKSSLHCRCLQMSFCINFFLRLSIAMHITLPVTIVS